MARDAGEGAIEIPYPDPRFGSPCQSNNIAYARLDWGTVVWENYPFHKGAMSALLTAVSRARPYCLETGYVPVNSGSYNCRSVRGGTSWSLHAWPTAIDIDAPTNPQGQSFTTIPDEVVHAFTSSGFTFGLAWNDPHHFEIKTWQGVWNGTYPEEVFFVALTEPEQEEMAEKVDKIFAYIQEKAKAYGIKETKLSDKGWAVALARKEFEAENT